MVTKTAVLSLIMLIKGMLIKKWAYFILNSLSSRKTSFARSNKMCNFSRFCFIIIFTNPIVKPPKQHANLKNLGCKNVKQSSKRALLGLYAVSDFCDFHLLTTAFTSIFWSFISSWNYWEVVWKEKLRKYCFVNFPGVMIKNLENQLRIDLFWPKTVFNSGKFFDR